MRAVWIVVLAAACGRLDFDAVSSSSQTGDAGLDGTRTPLAPSCTALAAACGPNGVSACCESPLVPGGTFLRGYDVAADALYIDMTAPATVSTFRLDKYEVTVGRFRAFVAAGMGTRAAPPAAGAGGRFLNGTANQGGWNATWNAQLPADTSALIAALECSAMFQTWTDAPTADDARPINCVDFPVAMAFCVWDRGFLPTETEWHYAASGGDEQRAYPWSSPPSSLALDDSTYASYYVDATKQCDGDMIDGCLVTDLVHVGSKPAGDARWGQSDLGGNVYEWTLDLYPDAYPLPCTDCANFTMQSYPYHSIRGGAFRYAGSALRNGYRNAWYVDDRMGVRCARAP
jgi:formylglycine-generating enzyme